MPTPANPSGWMLIRRKRDGQTAHVLATSEGHLIWCPGKTWILPPGWVFVERPVDTIHAVEPESSAA